MCTSTGIGAMGLLFETVLKTNDTVLIEKDCYGGTYRLLNILLDKNNIKTCYADFTDLDEVAQQLSKQPIALVIIAT